MPSIQTELKSDYGLAENAILAPQPSLPETQLDALARLAVLTSGDELYIPSEHSVAIRRKCNEIRITVSRDLPKPLLDCLGDIVALLRLPAGWNSYSAKPIEIENAIRAIKLVGELVQAEVPAPSIVPKVRGGIQLEWHTSSGDVEIYIDSPDQVSFFAEDTRTDDSTEAPLKNIDEVRGWLGRIFGK